MNKLLTLIFLSFTALAAGSCGFQPLYSQQTTNLGPIKLEPIEGRLGYLIEQELDRHFSLNSKSGDIRILKITFKNNYRNSNLRLDSFSSRLIIESSVNYKLDGNINNKPIANNFTTSVAYDTKESAYSEISMLQDAEERLAKQIADKIWFDLLAKNHK